MGGNIIKTSIWVCETRPLVSYISKRILFRMETTSSDRDGYNTETTLSLTDEKLPDDSEMDAEGLLYVLYASGVEYEQHWTRWGINNVLFEKQAYIDSDLRSSGEQLSIIDELVDPDSVTSILPGDSAGVVKPEVDTDEGEALRRSIQQSWDLRLTEESSVEIDFHATVQQQYPEIDTTELLSEYDLNTEESGRRLDPAFQQRCFVVTLILMNRELEQSTLTAREFASFHLGTRFSTSTASDIATRIFDSDVSAGAIRSNVSRVKEKYKAAQATADIVGDNQIAADMEPTNGHETSFISSDTKMAIKQHVRGVLSSHGGRDPSVVSSWDIADGMELYIEVDPSDERIDVRIYHDISNLSQTVVDTYSVEAADQPNVLINGEGTDKSPTNFAQLSPDHRITAIEIGEAIELGTTSDYWLDILAPYNVLLPAVNVLKGKNGNVVQFFESIELGSS
jgi:hypothetical protein